MQKSDPSKDISKLAFFMRELATAQSNQSEAMSNMFQLSLSRKGESVEHAEERRKWQAASREVKRLETEV